MTYGEYRNRERERAAADPAVGLRHHAAPSAPRAAIYADWAKSQRAAATAAPAPTSAPQNASGDPAEPILRGEPTLTDETRANLWDIYHASTSTTELERQLQSMGLRQGLVGQLLIAKNKQAAEKPALDRVTDAMQQMANIDPRVLDAAESHPRVLQALMEHSK
jgi:hypothetical protein